MSSWRSAVVLVLAGSLGCSGLLHERRADSDLPLAERPWRVRCGWFLPPSADPEAPPGLAGSGDVWASDASERRLALDARLEDGFLLVEAARAESDDDERDVVSFEATAEAVREACSETIRRGEESATGILYRVRGVRDGEGVEVPLVFPNDPARPAPISRLVVFGDSLSDGGKLKVRMGIMPFSPYWLGRFSNGPNWLDHLALRAGLSIQNHSVGGAVATRHEDVPVEQVATAVSQGGQFFVSGSLEGQVRDYLERDLTTGFVQQPDDTVFMIWGGANDYISKEPFTEDFGALLDTPDDEAGYRRVVAETVAGLSDQIRALHAAGARRFAVLNLPNLGATPIVSSNTSYRAAEVESGAISDDARRLLLARKLAELTLHHNRELGRALEQLGRELPDATLVMVKAGDALQRMLEGTAPESASTPFDYGFDLRTHAVTLRDGSRQLVFQKSCYTGGYLGSEDPEAVCPETAIMFWDSVHPSSYTHCWISYFVARDMVRAGWLARLPSTSSQRDYCAQFVQRLSSTSQAP